MRLFDDHSLPVTLTREIGRGGEGFVAETGDANLVAKVYLGPVEPERVAKLNTMARLANAELLRVAAWPVSTLRDSVGGPVVGFLQPRVANHREVHQLYSPIQRRQHFPDVDWSFLLHVAMNCAAGIETVHAAGHVIGDVNQSGIFVARNGTVRLIDCDSFQIQTGSLKYRCVVGVPLFTPPELQGLNFRDVDRTPSHDCFGLAVIVFQLLFMGRHPFAGRFSGGGDMPIERAISERRFAFSRHATSFQMLPPPHALSLESLPSEIGEMFERAFTTSGGTDSRPTAEEWRHALAAFKNRLSKCRIDASHVFGNVVGHCPWCRIEQGGGPAFFTSVASTLTFEGAFNLSSTWRRIEAVRRPPPRDALAWPTSPPNIVASPIPTDAQWERLSASRPEPVRPISGEERLPELPKFIAELVEDDPVYGPEALPEIPPYIKDDFVEKVDAAHRKSANKWIRLLFPGSSQFQYERRLAEIESKEHRARWLANSQRLQLRRETITTKNERRQMFCQSEGERLARLRIGLAERNALRYSAWEDEVTRIKRMRQDIEERNRAMKEKWSRDFESYQRAKSLFDAQQIEIMQAKAKRDVERRRRQVRFDQLMSKAENLRRTWANDSAAAIAEFEFTYRELAAAKNTHEEMRREFERRKSDLQHNQRELQLRDYLCNALIDTANITGLGPKKRATLAAYGIETAYQPVV